MVNRSMAGVASGRVEDLTAHTPFDINHSQ
jgi:hypothetical protein